MFFERHLEWNKCGLNFHEIYRLEILIRSASHPAWLSRPDAGNRGAHAHPGLLHTHFFHPHDVRAKQKRVYLSARARACAAFFRVPLVHEKARNYGLGHRSEEQHVRPAAQKREGSDNDLPPQQGDTLEIMKYTKSLSMRKDS